MAIYGKRDHLPSLLLLPFPPEPAGRQALSAAYRPSIAAALAKLKGGPVHSKLIIAVVCPILQGPFARSKALAWPEAQSLLAGLYTLVAVICAELSIPAEADAGPGSVDATVVLVDHDRKKRFFPDFRPAVEPNNTVVVDFSTFASAYYPWNYIFHVRSEVGLEVYQTYLKLAEGRQALLQSQLVAVDGGLTLNLANPSPPARSPSPTYPTVCLGGTFDHLHPGHKLLLMAAALLLAVPEKGSSQPCTYIIGITGDEMLRNKKFAAYVQPWEDRARGVIAFLATVLGLSSRGWKDGDGYSIDEGDGEFVATLRDGTIAVRCVKIQDAFGPTITLEDIHALVVSGETRSGGQAVNDRRASQGWGLLEVYEVDVLDANEIQDAPVQTEGFAAKLSSTAIRKRRADAATTSPEP